MDEKITIEDFLKVDLRIGKIVLVEDVEDSRKLLKLNVNIGDEVRTVFAGIKKSYSPDDLLGKLVVIIVNLKPREMKFGVSDGMVLATQDNDQIIILQPEKEVPSGSKIS
jgi:methionyl-tRNA synthetase|tara:strand:- start:1062 stop:1391 length:330 start_codon:yes stop_codon:yes gene_type:complete